MQMIPNERSTDGMTPQHAGAREASPGALVVNADDWGRDHATTERMLECTRRGSVSSVSAMVFMEDSERSADIARSQGIDAGLHLNLTTPLSGSGASTKLADSQQRLSRYLRRHRLAPVMFHPGLSGAFEYVVRSQLDEFVRLFGAQPGRIDGHHHMHLCANVVLPKLLPSGTIVRRNFTFRSGEKGLVNRLYRSAVDRRLARRHQLVDYLFTLPPMEPAERLTRIFSLAQRNVVELEVHPAVPDEHRFLTGGEFLRWTQNVQVKPFTAVAWRQTPRPGPAQNGAEGTVGQTR